MFRVGQKVVCVNDRWRNEDGKHDYITKGVVYVVTGYGRCRDGSQGVHLDGVKNLGGAPFYKWRFRPVTDISIFTDILDKVSRGDLVEVR